MLTTLAVSHYLNACGILRRKTFFSVFRKKKKRLLPLSIKKQDRFFQALLFQVHFDVENENHRRN
jgi:hypothetical protein